MRCYKLVLPLLVVLSSCGLFPKQEDPTKDMTAAQIYSLAKADLDNAEYESAINFYEKLQARYPFGRYAQQAQIEIAYAYYRYEEPEQAIAAADRFIKLHPKHPNVDYAYYLKGLANFNRGIGLLERYIPSKSAERDPGAASQSFFDFEKLVRQYPTSKYAEDARQRMLYLRNNLASYEMAVAEYYVQRGAYLAAINRAKYVVEHYQRSPSVPDALGIILESYRVLGLDDLAVDTERVIRANYPDHPVLGVAARDPEASIWRQLLDWKLFE